MGAIAIQQRTSLHYEFSTLPCVDHLGWILSIPIDRDSIHSPTPGTQVVLERALLRKTVCAVTTQGHRRAA